MKIVYDHVGSGDSAVTDCYSNTSRLTTDNKKLIWQNNGSTRRMIPYWFCNLKTKDAIKFIKQIENTFAIPLSIIYQGTLYVMYRKWLMPVYDLALFWNAKEMMPPNYIVPKGFPTKMIFKSYCKWCE